MESATMRMQAVISEPANHSAGLVLCEMDRPNLAVHEALVRTAAVSVDRDELARVLESRTGKPFGSDLVGTVEVAAADGSGIPAVCARDNAGTPPAPGAGGHSSLLSSLTYRERSSQPRSLTLNMRL